MRHGLSGHEDAMQSVSSTSLRLQPYVITIARCCVTAFGLETLWAHRSRHQVHTAYSNLQLRNGSPLRQAGILITSTAAKSLLLPQTAYCH